MSEPVEQFGIEPIICIVDLSNVTIEPIDARNVAVNLIEETFVELIKKIFINEEFKKKYTIFINEENLNIINKIISQTPNIFNDIEKSIKEIINDGKINSNDVPQLIILVQIIYQVVYNINDSNINSSKRIEFTANILKFLIKVLVIERKINIEKDKEDEFYKQTDLLIDSCVSLLNYSKAIKPKSCLKSLFGK